MITRIAPTPSGYLHLGNAANFQLVAWLADRADGRVVLRIDDMDAPRFRGEFVDDIFDVLAWMDVRWDDGPRSPDAFARDFSLRARSAVYRTALDEAVARGLPTYACRCSRSMLRGPAVGDCPGGCRQQRLPLVRGESALRVHVPRGTTITVGEAAVHLDEAMGDFVVWRRDDAPAYHLASVVEDRDAHITHIVRGEDLCASTAAQLYLSPYLDAGNVSSATFLHHGLVTGVDGAKLSKSTLAAGPMPRTPERRRLILEVAARLGAEIGISPPG